MRAIAVKDDSPLKVMKARDVLDTMWDRVERDRDEKVRPTGGNSSSKMVLVGGDLENQYGDEVYNWLKISLFTASIHG